MAIDSIWSLKSVAVPCALMKAKSSFPTLSIVCCKASSNPSAVFDGALIWKASFFICPCPIVQTRLSDLSVACSPVGRQLLSTTVAAASPKLRPWRSMSKGLQGSADMALSDWKPEIIKRWGQSAPQTITWSYVPNCNSRDAKIIAAEPEIQALHTTTGRVVKPNRVAIRCAVSPK